MFRAHGDELFALGVTPVQAGIVLYLLQQPGSYIRQCARALGVKYGTLGPAVLVLQRNQYVLKRHAPQDDR